MPTAYTTILNDDSAGFYLVRSAKMTSGISGTSIAFSLMNNSAVTQDIIDLFVKNGLITTRFNTSIKVEARLYLEPMVTAIDLLKNNGYISAEFANNLKNNFPDLYGNPSNLEACLQIQKNNGLTSGESRLKIIDSGRLSGLRKYDPCIKPKRYK